MRIASLVPSATEALFALGLGDDVVAVTHECDHPAAARDLPRLTRSVVSPGLAPGEIDARVRELVGAGEALYELDEAALAGLEPDLIVTQAVCAVCAVSYDDVVVVAGRLPSHPRVLSLDPSNLDDVLDDMVRLAAATGEPERGHRLRDELAARIEAVKASVDGSHAPRVLALEWLDPPFVAGHWVPDMIVAAGGVDCLARPGERSEVRSWNVLATAGAETVVVMPCGLYADEAAEQAAGFSATLESLGAARIVAVDAASTFSRPGPRLADGVELLGHLLHPDRVPAPDMEWRELGIGG